MSPQVSETLLSILAVLNNAVVLMVFTPNYKSPSPFKNPLLTVPKAPIRIGIIVTLISKFEVLILFFIFFKFYFMVNRDSKVYNFASSFLLLIIIRSGPRAEIR